MGNGSRGRGGSGWGPTCSNSQRAPEEMKTSILTQLLDPFHFPSASFAASCCSSCSRPTSKSLHAFRWDAQILNVRVPHGVRSGSQLSAPRQRRGDGRTNAKRRCRHTLGVCTEVWDVCAGQAGARPRRPHTVAREQRKGSRPGSGGENEDEMGGGEEKKWHSQEKQHPLK